MGDHYYYEVEYICSCEVCDKSFTGMISRGPLESNDGIFSAAATAADMKLSEKLIKNYFNGTGALPFTATNADSCPYCGARQSWYSVEEPRKPAGAGACVGAALIGMLVGIIPALIVYAAVGTVLSIILIIAACGALGAFLAYLRYAKNGNRDKAEYVKKKQCFDEYTESLKTRTKRNKPEIIWNTAHKRPCNF